MREWEFSSFSICPARTECYFSLPLEAVYVHKSPATTIPCVRRKFSSHHGDTRRRNGERATHVKTQTRETASFVPAFRLIIEVHDQNSSCSLIFALLASLLGALIKKRDSVIKSVLAHVMCFPSDSQSSFPAKHHSRSRSPGAGRAAELWPCPHCAG